MITKQRRRRVAKRRVKKSKRGLGKNRGSSPKIYTFDFNLQPQVYRSGVSVSEPPINRTGPATGPLQIGDFVDGPAQTGIPLCLDVGWATPFRLNDIANSADFQALFDEYKINYIDVAIEALTSPSTSGPQNGSGAVGVQAAMPTMYLFEDRDSNLPPVNTLSITGLQGVKKMKLGAGDKNIMKMRFRPRAKYDNIGSTTAVPAVSLAGLSQKATWIDCLYPNVAHYGMKGFVTDWLSTGTPNQWTGYRFNFRYNVSFRQPITAT